MDRSGSVPDSSVQAARVAAAVAIQDRAWGKPRQRREVISAGERVGYVVAGSDGSENPKG